jgi:hypothetical protein
MAINRLSHDMALSVYYNNHVKMRNFLVLKQVVFTVTTALPTVK